MTRGLSWSLLTSLALLWGCSSDLPSPEACEPQPAGDGDPDNDGYPATAPPGSTVPVDCADNDVTVFPGAPELCDDKDNDCDGETDEGVGDSDEDGILDCDDVEECDGVDNDGDGILDEGAPDKDLDGIADCVDIEDCDREDNDGDGYIDEDFPDDNGNGIADCAEPLPVELCNGVDDDGDGKTDEGFVNTDGDAMADCVDPDDDNDGLTDGLEDVDTDGTQDPTESDPLDPDSDNDGVCDGPLTPDVNVCVAGPDNCVLDPNTDQADQDDDDIGDECDDDIDGDGDPNATDCADTDPTIFTGATELCDLIDSDCDNSIIDEFGDTNTNNIPDCLEEQCDGVDNTGEGNIDEGYPNTDGDSMADCVDPDDDGDGIPDVDEDEDGDGTVAPTETDPLDPDTDDDGICDGPETPDTAVCVPAEICETSPATGQTTCVDVGDNCPLDPNFDQSDVDLDGPGDVCDDDADGDGFPNDDEDVDGDGLPSEGESDWLDPDTDDDGICDGPETPDPIVCEAGPDNCVLDPNFDQSDVDGDDFGDACDDDADGDGIPNDGEDIDGDGIPDDDESSWLDPDTDDDGICDGPETPDVTICAAGPDNCVLDPNFDQADGDTDDIGDVCDDDLDNDGDPNGTDCDDANPAIFTGATEICDLIDQDCDGDLIEAFGDADGDLTPDCLDAEVCDGVDNDGDSVVDEGVDNDGDGADDCGKLCTFDLPATDQIVAFDADCVVTQVGDDDPARDLVGIGDTPYWFAFDQPIVGQLTDDNGDGKIDATDIPDIIITDPQGEGFSDLNDNGQKDPTEPQNAGLTVVSGDGSGVIWSINTYISQNLNSWEDECFIASEFGAATYLDDQNTAYILVPVWCIDTQVDPVFGGDGTLLRLAQLSPTADGLNLEEVWTAETPAALEVKSEDFTLGHPAIGFDDGDVVFGFAGQVFDFDLGNFLSVSGFHPKADHDLFADITGDGSDDYFHGGALLDYRNDVETNLGIDSKAAVTVDFNDDGLPEIATIGKASALIDIWSAGTKVFTYTPTVATKFSSLMAADLTGDGLPEIVTLRKIGANPLEVLVLQTNGLGVTEYVITGTDDKATLPSAYDVDGDGIAELIAGSDIWSLEGGVLTSKFQLPPDHYGIMVTNVDEDPFAELLAWRVSTDVPGGSYAVLTALSLPFGATHVGMWNQYNYVHSEAEPAGTWPTDTSQPWLGSNATRTGYPTGLSGAQKPGANLSVDVDACTDCSVDLYIISASVTNDGAADATGVSVSLYIENADGTRDLYDTIDIGDVGSGVQTGRRNFTVDLLDLTGDLVVVVDSASEIPECDETDNEAPVTVALCEAGCEPADLSFEDPIVDATCEAGTPPQPDVSGTIGVMAASLIRDPSVLLINADDDNNDGQIDALDAPELIVLDSTPVVAPEDFDGDGEILSVEGMPDTLTLFSADGDVLASASTLVANGKTYDIVAGTSASAYRVEDQTAVLLAVHDAGLNQTFAAEILINADGVISAGWVNDKALADGLPAAVGTAASANLRVVGNAIFDAKGALIHLAPSVGLGGHPLIADLFNDGSPEVVFGGLYVSADGTETKVQDNGHTFLFPLLADINGDNVPEIFAGDGEDVVVFDPANGQIVSQFGFKGGFTPQVIVENNGAYILAGLNDDADVLVVDFKDPKNATVVPGPSMAPSLVNLSVGSVPYMIVGGGLYDLTKLAFVQTADFETLGGFAADFDGDFSPEILSFEPLASGRLALSLYNLPFSAERPAGVEAHAEPVWTQYHSVDGLSAPDGTLADAVPAWWSLDKATRATAVSLAELPVGPAADLTIEYTTCTACLQGNVVLYIAAINSGPAASQAGVLQIVDEASKLVTLPLDSVPSGESSEVFEVILPTSAIVGGLSASIDGRFECDSTNNRIDLLVDTCPVK